MSSKLTQSSGLKVGVVISSREINIEFEFKLFPIIKEKNESCFHCRANVELRQ